MTERHLLVSPPVEGGKPAVAEPPCPLRTVAHLLRTDDRLLEPGAAAEPSLSDQDDLPAGRRRFGSRLLLPPLGVVAAPAAILLAAGITASAALFWDDPDEPSTGSARPQAGAMRSAADLRGLGRTLIEPGDGALRQVQPNGAPRPEDSRLQDSRRQEMRRQDPPPPLLTDVPTPVPAAPQPSSAAKVVDPVPSGGPRAAGLVRADGEAPWPHAPAGAGEDGPARLNQDVRPVIEDLLANPPAAGPGEPNAPGPIDGQSPDNDYPDPAATMTAIPSPAASGGQLRPVPAPPAAAPPDRWSPRAQPAPRPEADLPPRQPAVAKLEVPEMGAAERPAVEPGAAEWISGAPRVFVHYSTRSERGRDIAAATARHLEARGYQVADIRTVGFDIAAPRVRYFFDGDRAAAQRLTSDLRTYLDTTIPGQPPADLQSYTTFKPLPSPGNIEVWIPSGGGS